MQTKQIIPVILSLFISATVAGQKDAYTATINNTRPPEVRNSFQLNVLADKAATVFSLGIQNPEKKKLHLQISHRVFGTLIDTVISNEQFSKRYNMEQADDGEYVVKVSCGKEKIRKEVELNTITTRNVVVH